MGKALIIAEKPSVARDIAKALGGFKSHDDYFESDQYVLASAVGHLLELAVPPQYEVKRGKWSFAHLPVIPPHFDLQPIEKTASKLRLLERLIKRKDVDSLINACDAGREGELIFRYIVKYTGTAKPIRRLWLQSMTPAAIREGFASLRADEELQPLATAAICRSESDWLVGINGTRALTAFNSRSGGFQKTTVGRVQTPTLAILVEREHKIRKFVPRDYWEVHATFTAQAGTYTGRWFDEKFVRDKEDAELRPERLWDAQRAEDIRARCLGKPGVVTEESKPATQLSPLLYDLTSLQREANSRFGFSAKATLSLAQALYEKHKVITYPRTDSRALPEDYQATVRQTLKAMEGTDYGTFARTVLEQGWVRPNKRIFSNAKVSDHFAIIPTPLEPKHLTDAERKIYDMIARRFLAVFYPAAEYLVTTRITRVEGEPFKSEGKVMLNPGWLAVYGKEAPADDTPSLVPVQPGEAVDTTEIQVEKSQTRPPPRFTEATLLSAMEGAGKLVEDEELREAMAAKGLGTPATRAAIIEGLIEEKYVVRHGKELVPTAKAFSLIVLLNGLGIPELCKPELTGDWEFKLKLMERGQMRREDFMREIEAMTRHIVEQARNYHSDTVPGDFGELKTPCPKCGGLIKENYRNFQCQNCNFAFRKIVAGRILEHEEAEALVSRKVIGPLQGFRSQKGFPFAAMLRLADDGNIELDFGNGERKNGQAENGEKENGAAVDFSGKEPLGQCPKCGQRVFEAGMAYLCEKATGPEKTCDFRTGTVILQRKMAPEEMKQLLAEGKTGLLKGFVSKRNGRTFDAHLVLGKDGSVGFEFAARPGRAKDAKKSADQPPPPKLDFSGQKALGKCPRCGGGVYEGPDAYLCERTQLTSRACKFKVGKVILQQPLDAAQITKLLAERRTDVLDGFISKKTGKPFKAALVLDEKERVAFEFPEREAGA
ncbi:DNA topoisomerase III [Fontisphaera persica]|uniref:DNA topoisomerase III n=1 Tax=Fontisphaera persica TaxID=2974023 RepID=UPI0024C0D0E3|nr:DNA topoisomerase III [Fontisphaera persica]WCJ60511.1 DNA topoisomerase III [Fontisphaera persica]